MIYSEVVAKKLILPKKTKYTVKDVEKVMLNSLFKPVNGKTLTIKEAIFIVKSSAAFHETDYSKAINTMKTNPAPRIGTAKPKRKSQVSGKAPTKRLIARRMANAKKGFFPNPLHDEIIYCVRQTRDPGNHSVSNEWLNVGWSRSKENAEILAHALFNDNKEFSVCVEKMKLSEFHRK